MDDRLSGVTAKLERAKDQIEQLRTAHIGFIADAYTVVAEADHETLEYRVRAPRGKDPPVIDWAVEIGEIFHNLRSALDHFAYQLAGASAGRHTQFPITDSPE